MISFPVGSWQSALIQKTTKRRPSDGDQAYGRLATPISPRLYLSDLYTARAPGNLARMGITHVVSALEADLRAELGVGVVTMHVPIRDSPDADIAKWFDEVVRFIQNALDADERNKVLVHCFQGISRSATLVCAYLVATSSMRALDALAYPNAPNLGFRRQLVIWGSQFDEEKARAEEERRKKRRCVNVVGEAWSRWVGKEEKPSGQV